MTLHLPQFMIRMIIHRGEPRHARNYKRRFRKNSKSGSVFCKFLNSHSNRQAPLALKQARIQRALCPFLPASYPMKLELKWSELPEIAKFKLKSLKCC